MIYKTIIVENTFEAGVVVGSLRSHFASQGCGEVNVVDSNESYVAVEIPAITKREHNDTAKSVLVDPCTHIECGLINCDRCPLKSAAVELREAQARFMEILGKIEENNICNEG